MEDAIVISGLAVRARIGAHPAERRRAQRLSISLRVVPVGGFHRIPDDLARTIDYAAVCAAVQREIARRPRKLIETLAGDLAAIVLAEFPARAVEIEVRKFILPKTDYVGVSIRRERGRGTGKRTGVDGGSRR